MIVGCAVIVCFFVGIVYFCVFMSTVIGCGAACYGLLLVLVIVLCLRGAIGDC